MNLIPRLPKDHVFYEGLDLDKLIYFFIISTTSTYKGVLWCTKDVSEVYDLFSKFYSEKDIEYAMKSLEDKKVIIVEDETIEVGTLHGSVKQLYTGDVISWDAEREQIETLVNNYIAGCKGGRARIPEKLKEDTNKLFELEISKWRTYEFMQLYRYTHEATYQEQKPDFDKAEIGIMSNLLKKYGVVMCIKLIVYYITNADTFSKSIPTIRSLSFFKEEIYGRVTKLKTSKRETLRATIKDDDF